jgi:hypothetical protein
MENLVYLIVKSLSATYLLHRVFRFLSEKQVREFWCFLTPENPVKEIVSVPVPETAPSNIVGKSQTVYLEEPPKEKPKTVEPAFSEDLQQAPSYEEEPDITGDDVDDNLNKDGFPEEDRLLPLDAEADDGDFPSSSGMTYEQISQALDVVQGKSTDDAGRQTAARILYEVEGSDLFNFLTAQAENEALVEKLIRENIDNGGVPFSESTRKQRRNRKEFDMDKYV